MARGALRGAATAWFGLIVLQVVTTQGGSSKVGGALDVVNSIVKRALDPNVAAIPDYSKGTPAASSGSGGPITPQQYTTGASNAGLILSKQWPTNVPGAPGTNAAANIAVLPNIDWTQLANNPALQPGAIP